MSGSQVPLPGATHYEELIAQLMGGADFHSSGHFTLSVQERVRKIGELSRAHPFRWATLAVQSAVGLSASCCRISLSKDCISIGWSLGDPPAWLLQGTFLDQLEGEGQDAGQTFLCRSLLWAYSQLPLSCNLLVQGPCGGFLLSGRQDENGEWTRDFRRLDPSSGTDTHCCLVFKAACGDLHVRSAAGRAAFHKDATYRFAICRIPVSFDGTELSQGLLSPILGRLGAPETAPFCLLQLRAAQTGPLLPVQLPPASSLDTYQSGLTYRFQIPGSRGRMGRLSLVREDGQFMALNHRIGKSGEARGTLSAGFGELVLAHYGSKCVALTNCPPLLPWTKGHRLPAGALLVRSGSMNGSLVVCHHGMLLDPVSIQHLRPGWMAVLASDEMPADASGYQPVKGALWLEAEAKASQLFRTWATTASQDWPAQWPMIPR